MTYLFHPEAEAEFVDAINYYEECEKGLGEDFSLEINSTIRNILAFPTAWPVIDGPVRRCLSHRFPYGVLYSIEHDKIFLLAVMHLHRHPDYWKKRR
jgi:plasmid stabilization system protein ParE